MARKFPPLFCFLAAMWLSAQGLATAARPEIRAAPAVTRIVPVILDSSPTGDNVGVLSVIEIAFSVPMYKASIKTAFSVSPAVRGAYSWSGTVLRYTPIAPLAPSTTYTVTVTTAAKSTTGGRLKANYAWSFTTEGPVQTRVIACVGDSITEGLYPPALRPLVGKTGDVQNFGAGGTTVIINNGGLAVPYITTAVCQQAQQAMPAIVIIMLGSNDSDTGVYAYISRFVADYEKLIAQFEAVPSQPKIWLVTPPAIYGTPYGLSNRNLAQGVIPRIYQVASATGLPTIDVYSATTGHPEYFVDGVHPNSVGAAVIAQVIYQAIAPDLASLRRQPGRSKHENAPQSEP